MFYLLEPLPERWRNSNVRHYPAKKQPCKFRLARGIAAGWLRFDTPLGFRDGSEGIAIFSSTSPVRQRAGGSHSKSSVWNFTGISLPTSGRFPAT